MNYQISRGGQMYGPYTIEDIQRYVGLGNILPTDLAKSDAMADWIPVSQLLGTSAPLSGGMPVYPPVGYPVAPYGAPTAYPASALTYPDPPNLHWGLVLLFSFLTLGVFSLVWDLIQALWVKKVMPESKVVLYYALFIGFEVVNLAVSFSRMALLMGHHGRAMTNSSAMLVSTAIGAIVSIGVLVTLILFRFTMRSDLLRHFNTAEPLGLRLGGVMTFFFGGLYFQYHINRLMEIKQSIRYRTPVV